MFSEEEGEDRMGRMKHERLTMMARGKGQYGEVGAR